MSSPADKEHGQTSIVLVGFFVVVALLVVVVVDASAAYLRRQRLDSLADGAAAWVASRRTGVAEARILDSEGTA